MRNPIDRLTEGLPHGWRVTIDWLVTIVGAILIVLAIKEWVINPYRIPSSSMEPTLHCARPGLGVRGALLRPRPRLPLLLPLLEPEARRHRRLQHAAARGGALRRRRDVRQAPDRAARATPGRRRTATSTSTASAERAVHQARSARRPHRSPPMKIPPGQYFMMGDNRASSCDSRRGGRCPRQNLIGKVFATYWPPSRHLDPVASPGLATIPPGRSVGAPRPLFT